jgi:hypothetical protein
MIRALLKCFVFGVFGPSLGLLTLFFVSRSGGSLNGPNPATDTFVVLLLFAYLNGLVPALIAAGFDSYLDRKGVKGVSKYLLTGAVGYAAAYVNIIGPLLLFVPKWGLLGAIPAVICSAISDQIMSPVQKFCRA